MSEKGKTAYITGGASGIARATAEMLAKRGINIIIADQNAEGATEVAKHLVDTYGIQCSGVQVNVASWEQQADAFRKGTASTRIDYVFAIAGIGEKPWIPNNPKSGASDYEEPNLVVLDVDLKGVLYTAALAIQHFRRQQPDANGFKGKIITVASICGLYCVPTLPIYTAAKHGVVGFTRTYGYHLPDEGITLNAICPNIVQTNISTGVFYAQAAEQDLLVPIANVVAAIEGFLGSDTRSGECIEVGPRGTRSTSAPEPMDQATKLSLDLVHERGRPLHVAKS